MDLCQSASSLIRLLESCSRIAQVSAFWTSEKPVHYEIVEEREISMSKITKWICWNKTPTWQGESELPKIKTSLSFSRWSSKACRLPNRSDWHRSMTYLWFQRWIELLNQIFPSAYISVAWKSGGRSQNLLYVT